MVDSQTKYYDTHTLFIKCGIASANEIYQIFNEALNNYNKAYNSQIECNFNVNLVETRDNNSIGIAFVFVSNPAVYHIMLGKNPDGGARVEYHDDPSWIKPIDEITLNNPESPESNVRSLVNMDWSMLMEMDEEYEKSKNRYICPKIEVQLSPLIDLSNHFPVDRAIVTNLDAKFMPNVL